MSKTTKGRAVPAGRETSGRAMQAQAEALNRLSLEMGGFASRLGDPDAVKAVAMLRDLAEAWWDRAIDVLIGRAALDVPEAEGAADPTPLLTAIECPPGQPVGTVGHAHGALANLTAPGAADAALDRPLSPTDHALVTGAVPKAEGDEAGDDQGGDVPGGGYQPGHPWFYLMGGMPPSAELVGEGCVQPEVLLSIEGLDALKPESRRRKVEDAISDLEAGLPTAFDRYESVREVYAAKPIGRRYRLGDDVPARDMTEASSMAAAHNAVCYLKKKLAEYRALLADVQRDVQPEPLDFCSLHGGTKPGDEVDIVLRLAMDLLPVATRLAWRDRGASDATIREQLGTWWGLDGRRNDPVSRPGGYWVRGGTRPALWVGDPTPKPGKGGDKPAAKWGTPTLQGPALVARVRKLLGVASPARARKGA